MGAAVPGADFDQVAIRVGEYREIHIPRLQARSVNGAAISPDGQLVATGGGYLYQPVYHLAVWELESGDIRCSMTDLSAIPRSVAFSPDSQTAFSVSQDGMLVQWKLAEKSLPELLDWIQKNRYVAPLTCEQKSQYLIEPLCSP